MSDTIQAIAIFILALLNAAMIGAWVKEIYTMWNDERKMKENGKNNPK